MTEDSQRESSGAHEQHVAGLAEHRLDTAPRPPDTADPVIHHDIIGHAIADRCDPVLKEIVIHPEY